MILILLFQGSISHTFNLITRAVRDDGDEIDLATRSVGQLRLVEELQRCSARLERAAEFAAAHIP